MIARGRRHRWIRIQATDRGPICFARTLDSMHGQGATSMSTSITQERIAEASPRLKARIAGGLWLLCIIASVGGIIASVGGFIAAAPLIVANDAAATAKNILANESLFRLGFAADLTSGLSYLGGTVFLYYVLKTVSKSLSLLAAFFGLAGVAIRGPRVVSHLRPF